MKCESAQKNINCFLKGTLKGNELRKTYYHLAKCNKCKEVLLDEFSFYTTFNDLDKDLDFNYEKNLNRFMRKIGDRLKNQDETMTRNFVIASILICIFLIILLALAIRIVYR